MACKPNGDIFYNNFVKIIMAKIIYLSWNPYLRLKLLYMYWNFYRKISNFLLQNLMHIEHLKFIY